MKRLRFSVIAVVCSGILFSGSAQQDWALLKVERNINQVGVTTSGGIYIATEDTGLFRSANGGTSFDTCALPSNDKKVRCFQEVGQGKLLAGSHTGMYVSTNNGVTWALLDNTASGLTNTNIRSIAMNRSNGDVYTGDGDGDIYRSTDNGASWSMVMTGNATDGMDYLVVNPVAGTVYAGTGTYSDTTGHSGIHCFSSKDSGTTWSPVDLGLASPLYAGYRLGAAQDGRILVGYLVYTAVAGPGHVTAHGLYTSTSDGTSWAKLDTALTMSLACSGNTIYAGGLGTRMSTDSGAHWSQVGTTYPGVTTFAVIISLTTDSQGAVYAGVQGYGVYRIGGSLAVVRADHQAAGKKAASVSHVSRQPLGQRGDRQSPAVSLQGRRELASTARAPVVVPAQ